MTITIGRSCTCHPDDNPPRPCPGKFALSECRAAATGRAEGLEEALRVAEIVRMEIPFSLPDGLAQRQIAHTIACRISALASAPTPQAVTVDDVKRTAETLCMGEYDDWPTDRQIAELCACLTLRL